jgi:hypothetical protein
MVIPLDPQTDQSSGYSIGISIELQVRDLPIILDDRKTIREIIG